MDGLALWETVGSLAPPRYQCLGFWDSYDEYPIHTPARNTKRGIIISSWMVYCGILHLTQSLVFGGSYEYHYIETDTTFQVKEIGK